MSEVHDDHQAVQELADDAAQVFDRMLCAERDRARAQMLAEGMPPAQVEELLAIAHQMHAGQLALIVRELGLQLGLLSIH